MVNSVKRSVSVHGDLWDGALHLALVRTGDVVGDSWLVSQALGAFLQTASPAEQEMVLEHVTRRTGEATQRLLFGEAAAPVPWDPPWPHRPPSSLDDDVEF